MFRCHVTGMRPRILGRNNFLSFDIGYAFLPRNSFSIKVYSIKGVLFKNILIATHSNLIWDFMKKLKCKNMNCSKLKIIYQEDLPE